MNTTHSHHINALSASSISGMTVINAKAETVGTIEDLMIDLDTGDTLYAVLSVDTGFLNLGSKYFAVPLEEFEVRPTEREATLHVEKERLEKSPGFDKDHWPSGPQHEFVTEVNTFYGRTPLRKPTREQQARERNPNYNKTGEHGKMRTTEDDLGRKSVSDKEHLASTDFNKNTL